MSIRNQMENCILLRQYVIFENVISSFFKSYINA